MDINTHLNLRSFIQPSGQPIIMAVIFVLLIHSLFFIIWKENEKIAVAELPEWINIKLSFGTEEKINSQKKNLKDTKHKIITNKKTKALGRTKQNLNKIVSSKKATTFIKADSRPYKLENAKPIYPASARRRGMQGVVLLSVGINEKGHVETINIIRTSGFNVLDRSAVSSVESWRFIPAKDGETYVASLLEIPVRFILKSL